ncbi:hypothetical protein F2P81_024130 [Scophthalmus maximus]|uniref:Uncharacterized protein n=1 Tax=Scophthalmus maximus TaxID=52904 RepID=A0A6A4RVV6_SCOMX|nr:hypothetical protein F2P81_024130 [Scophthalmus maximus]
MGVVRKPRAAIFINEQSIANKMTAKHLTHLQQTANSSTSLNSLSDRGAVLMWRVTMTPVTSPTDSDVALMQRLLVSIDSLPRPFLKTQLPPNCNHSCRHVRGKQKTERAASDSRFFQFNGGLSLKVKVMEISNRLDELFKLKSNPDPRLKNDCNIWFHKHQEYTTLIPPCVLCQYRCSQTCIIIMAPQILLMYSTCMEEIKRSIITEKINVSNRITQPQQASPQL